MHHYRKTFKKYKSHQSQGDCPFCRADRVSEALYEDEYIYIVPNLTKYDLWELYDVTEHLLVIPKRHVENLGELNAEEKLAIMEQIAAYEARGYNVYARGVGFVNRSVKHQHTHLIKVTNTVPNVALFLRRPRYLFKK